MKVPVELAHLNAPHFHITGKSLGERLDTRVMRDLKLEWDDETKELAITWGGRTGYAVSSNVKAYFPFDAIPLHPSLSPPQLPKLEKRTAQVSTPQDHVFAGPGGGKTK